jgi:hypothetical protein
LHRAGLRHRVDRNQVAQKLNLIEHSATDPILFSNAVVLGNRDTEFLDSILEVEKSKLEEITFDPKIRWGFWVSFCDRKPTDELEMPSGRLCTRLGRL